MSTKAISQAGNFRKTWNKFRTYITKPQNAILLALGIILTVTTIYPMFTIARDTVRLHPGSIDTQEAAKDYQFDAVGTTLTTYNWKNLFTDTITTRVGRERVTRSVGSGHADEFKVQEILKLDFHFPLHHAAVDPGRHVAEPV